MYKVLKYLTLAASLVVAYAVLSHGIILPRFLWENSLRTFQKQHPGQHIEVKRVALGLSTEPRLLLSGVSISNSSGNESLNVGLVRLALGLKESIEAGAPVVHSIRMKGLRLDMQTQQACTDSLTACIPQLPFELYAKPSIFTWKLQKLELEKAQFQIRQGTAVELSSTIDEFQFSSEAQDMSLGWRVKHRNGLESYVALKAMPSLRTIDDQQAFELNDVNIEFKGKWAGFPWTGTFAQSRLLISGMPVVKLAGEKMRLYIRRDDAPDTHQAAFSAQTMQGGLPMQPWAFEGAEWTFTHENAAAWTFNMRWLPEAKTLSIAPATLAGSEGMPATAHVRKPDCNNLAVAKEMRPGLSPVWAWENAWFRLLDTPPEHNANTMLCLQATL